MSLVTPVLLSDPVEADLPSRLSRLARITPGAPPPDLPSGLVGAGHIARRERLPAYRHSGFILMARREADPARRETAARDCNVPIAAAEAGRHLWSEIRSRRRAWKESRRCRSPNVAACTRRCVTLLGAALAMAATAAATEQLRVTFDPKTCEITISATALEEEGYEVRVETPGLSEVETGRDVGEPGIIYLPPRDGPIVLTHEVEEPDDAENVFFFHDFIEADGWELVARFRADQAGTWKLNGRFSSLGGALAPEVVIPVRALERGENLLHLRSEKPERPVLVYCRAIGRGSNFTGRVKVGHVDWRGRVTLAHRTRGAVATLEVAGPSLARRVAAVPERWWEDRTFIADRAVSVGRNLLEAQVEETRSFFHGGFNLVYDTQKRAYRMPHWVWAWGPTIKLLLDLEDLPEARTAGMAEAFRAAAMMAGAKSLEFGVTDPAHPAFGVSTVRWEPSRASPNGWVEYISTADSLFLAGWGWMALHRETNQTVYLERTKTLVAAAERLMEQYPVVPQDWVVERERWTPHTLDESVFGMIAFTQLHAVTKDAAVAAAGRRFLDSHLEHMGRESGLLERGWMRDDDKPIWEPDIKGHAWVIEGYIDAYRFSGDSKYLERARALADRVMECQRDDGAWTYSFKTPGVGDPIDDKGIAIWSYLFHELHRVTKDPRHLAAARRAIGWCLRHQYFGEDPHLDGAVVNTNSMAYVRRRPMTILYTNTFFALALLEELKGGTP